MSREEFTNDFINLIRDGSRTTSVAGTGHGDVPGPRGYGPGLTGIHFHDLRHAGNLLIAKPGANLWELMERMGHSTSRVALDYLQPAHMGSELAFHGHPERDSNARPTA